MLTKWINKPTKVVETGRHIEITAGEYTNLFMDPSSDLRISNAPIYAMEAAGDFTFACRVKPHFGAVYDAGAVMVYQSEHQWVKLAFENTDLGHTAVVSVANNVLSDDANGEKIEAAAIWLKVTKKDSVIGLYHSSDAVKWSMVRVYRHCFDADAVMYVGLLAQSPMGQGCSVEFDSLTFSKEPVCNLREGV